jgi:TolB protein
MNPPMRRTLSRLVLILAALAALVAGPAAAQSLNVEIVGGLKTAIPIAVVPFA